MDKMADALRLADQVWLMQSKKLQCSLSDLAESLSVPAFVSQDVNVIVEDIIKHAKPNDHIVLMSNKSFDDIHSKLLQALRS